MAKTSNLREFQEAILLRLKDAAEQGDVVSTSRLGVMVGAKRVLINLNDVSEVLPVPPLQAVPLTQQWFLGVANVRGNLYNITDLAQFIGQPPTPKSVNNRIVLLNSETTTQAALVVGSLIGLRNIDAMQVKKITESGDILFCKQALEDVDKNEWFELDIKALVQDNEFIQPTIS
ncbi:MAG: chemotaxis protein CheW [Methylotenera sp.]|nr:chemotaxis protein CheW [Methylotenera sp.]